MSWQTQKDKRGKKDTRTVPPPQDSRVKGTPPSYSGIVKGSDDKETPKADPPAQDAPQSYKKSRLRLQQYPKKLKNQVKISS